MMRHRLGAWAARILFGAALLLLAGGTPLSAQNQVQLFIDQSFIVKDSGQYCWYDKKGHHFLCDGGDDNCDLTEHPAGCCVKDTAHCPGPNPFPVNQIAGIISNDPEIQFEQTSFSLSSNCIPSAGILPIGDTAANVCNSDLFLCASIGYNNSGTDSVALDEVEFEMFQFKDGSNPLDPGSTPPLRTFFIDSPGIMPANSNSSNNPIGPYCVLLDGSYSIQGQLAKANGQFGFRVTVMTNQTGASGNITVTAQRAYPAGATQDSNGAFVGQKPITVDVTNIHVVRSSPTVVGTTGVYAQPYNISYRLSKDATMYITINATTYPFPVVRNMIPGQPRSGEGMAPAPILVNGDSWNGRANNGALMPSGLYLATLQAFTQDQYGKDLSYPTTVQLGLDPLQITDIRTQPVLAISTSLAVMSYTLTEPATVYIDIYPPNTQFCGDITNVTGQADVPPEGDPITGALPGPPKDFFPTLGSCTDPYDPSTRAPLIRHIEQIQASRTPVQSIWDGRDSNGNAVCTDGDYVFILYASLPSANGAIFNGNDGDRRIWTGQARTGFWSVLRGLVGVSQISPGATVIGSSPAVSGLNPFVFRYSLSRDAITNMAIYDVTGNTVVKTLISNAVRPGNFPNSETWNPATNDTGLWVSSGTYIAQLAAADPLCPMKVSTVSVAFTADLFRVTDLQTTPLFAGTSSYATFSYQLSQPMNIVWNIYPPGTRILNSATAWPPCASSGLVTGLCTDVVGPDGITQVAPIHTVYGMRPGRMYITEYWDGRDSNGIYEPDGSYVYTLAAQSTTTPKYFPEDQTFGNIVINRGSIFFPVFNVLPYVPPLFNSSATITGLAPFAINYSMTRQSSVTIQILNNNPPNAVVRTLFSGETRDGGVLLQDFWDGRDDNNNIPPADFYLVRAVAADVDTFLSQPATAQITISYNPLRIFDVAIRPLTGATTNQAHILYQVSQTMKVAIKIYRPGTNFDQYGNPIPNETTSLVKRIVGVRPALTDITDMWDGTDLRMGIAPDGIYRFSIIGSTDMSAISSLTGSAVTTTALAYDHPIDDIPVSRNDLSNPKESFEQNSFVYPNPIRGNSANFVIYTPFQAIAKLSIYTMNGDLVLSHDFEDTPAGCYVVDGCSPTTNPQGFLWNRSNSSGRRVARGVYYAVIRLEETLGGRNVFQTVKKLLVQ